MHFLCLHGRGTNTQVFEAQTVALRYEMEHHHTFDFVEGTIAVPIAQGIFSPCHSLPQTKSVTQSALLPQVTTDLSLYRLQSLTGTKEIRAYYPETDAYFNYFDHTSTSSMRTALAQLATYIALEGPYDGVLAYSHGAAFAATYIIQQAQLHPTLPPPFKCAIFLSGGIPLDPLALHRDEIRRLEPEKDGKPLKLPTAHIWGSNDKLYPDTSSVLSKLCDDRMKFVFSHEEGHDIPNARAEGALLGAAKVIRRTVDRALTAH